MNFSYMPCPAVLVAVVSRAAVFFAQQDLRHRQCACESRFCCARLFMTHSGCLSAYDYESRDRISWALTQKVERRGNNLSNGWIMRRALAAGRKHLNRYGSMDSEFIFHDALGSDRH